MIELTLAQVVGQNQFLSQRMLAVQSLLNSIRDDGISVGGLSPTLPIPFSRAAIIWEFGAVVSRGILPQDGMMVVVQMFRQQLLEQADAWERTLEGIDTSDGKPSTNLTPQILTLSDRKLVQLAGQTGYYDLQQCAMVKDSPPAFEGVSYNLAVPVKLEMLKLQQESKNVDDAKAKRNTPGSKHPGNGIVGADGRPIRPGGPAMGPPNDPHGAGGGPGVEAIRRHIKQGDGRNRAGDN